MKILAQILGECGSEKQYLSLAWLNHLLVHSLHWVCGAHTMARTHSGHSKCYGMCVFHLFQECHVAFPEFTSSLLPHLSFQTKYQCSSHMCLWYIINLHLS